MSENNDEEHSPKFGDPIDFGPKTYFPQDRKRKRRRQRQEMDRDIDRADAEHQWYERALPHEKINFVARQNTREIVAELRQIRSALMAIFVVVLIIAVMGHPWRWPWS